MNRTVINTLSRLHGTVEVVGHRKNDKLMCMIQHTTASQISDMFMCSAPAYMVQQGGGKRNSAFFFEDIAVPGNGANRMSFRPLFS